MPRPRSRSPNRRHGAIMSDFDRFINFSAEITAFPNFELLGTGQAQDYFDKTVAVVGGATMTALLNAYDVLRPVPHPEREWRLRREIFGDEKLGPIARNIVKMWYSGMWFELPRAWTEAYGAREGNVTVTVSGEAYTEGLLWPAVGAHPSGAKAPGYGSWFFPPQIPPVPPPIPPIADPAVAAR
jgi:hypothetical protein